MQLKITHYVPLAKRENMGYFKSCAVFARDQAAGELAAWIWSPIRFISKLRADCSQETNIRSICVINGARSRAGEICGHQSVPIPQRSY